MKKGSFQINIYSSILVQITSIICAFVLPRLILVSFGSSYNGIINSVNQFLSCVTLLRAGVGGVTRAALYKPLAQNDNEKISAIVKATEIFMRKIAVIFAVFLVIFALVYPVFVKSQFNYFFVTSLVIVLGISTVSQYFFGITYQILLQADQKLYVYNFIQILGTIANTIFSVILINFGCKIRVVKLASAVVFGITPILLFFYVRKNYDLNKNVRPDNSTIVQRWDAFAHQVAAFVNSNTDMMILTIFANLYQVSIYSVYNLVISGIKQLIITCSSAIEAMLGNAIVQENLDALNSQVKKYEDILNVVSCIAMLCSAILIVPFVMIYTKGVKDADYAQPLFAYLLCLSTFISCIRMPYQNLVEAAGHFKQTKNGAICEVVINVLLSVIFVRKYGCMGVIIGTIISTAFRTLQYADYASKVILHRTRNIFIKRFFVSFISIVVCMGIYLFLEVNKMLLCVDTYLEWIIHAVFILPCVCMLVLGVNLIFYWKEARNIIDAICKKFH